MAFQPCPDACGCIGECLVQRAQQATSGGSTTTTEDTTEVKED